MKPSRQLRPYQQAAVDAVFDKFQTYPSTIVVLPTGTGKTIVMAKIVSRWDRGNVLMLAHRTELILQAQDKFGSELGYLPAIEQGLRGSDAETLWQGGMVIIGSVDSMRSNRRLDKYRPTPFDLILIDESHHATSASYRKVVEYFQNVNPGCKVLGVTATPNRADGTALGTVFESVAYQYGVREAVDDGWLVPIRQEFVAIDSVDFSSLMTKKNEFGESDLNREQLEAVMVEEETLHAIARPIMELSQGRPTLVFAAGVPHAHMLAALLCRYRDGSARVVDGHTSDKIRAETNRDFAAGVFQFLVNFGVYTEGYDCPTCAVVAMGRPTKSLVLYSQMMGRGMRPLDGIVDSFADAADRKMAILTSDKPHMLALDFVGNSEHKLCSSYDVLGGNYDAEVRQLAAERAKKKPGCDVGEELEKAKAVFLLESEQKKRAAIKASVGFDTTSVDPFSHSGASPSVGGVDCHRGGASDGQVAFLVSLGVQYATAAGYGKKQASAVIEKLKGERCTVKMRNILRKYGENPDVNFDAASKIIDEIARSGWQPRRSKS